MTSTFFGLETAKRAMFAQQQGLYVTGQNIANVNTPGFSRQRVNFVQTEPYPAAAINRPEIPGQMGTGVESGTIERVRESFLDIQYRNENNKFGYWESRSEALSKMEDIMNEPTENGISAVMGEFWQSLQDLSVYPENEGTRKVVLQRAQSVVDTFHYVNESLTTIKNDFGNEIGINLQNINSILKQIGDLNRQIGEVEPHGYLPNDLYDQRDLLVDELSSQLNIKVNKVPSGGNPASIAEGQYEIKLVGEDGSETYLVSRSDYSQLGFTGSDGQLAYDVPSAIKNISVFNEEGKTVKSTIDIVDQAGKMNFSSGKLRGLIESYGYVSSETNSAGTPIEVEKGVYSDMLANLDRLAYSFANIFNKVHSMGNTLDGMSGTNQFFTMAVDSNVDFTEGNFIGASKDIMIGDLEPNDIAASTTDTSGTDGVSVNAGNGKNALNLANVASMLLSNSSQDLEGLTDTIDLQDYSVIENGTLNSFYESMIGQLGVDALQANRLTTNSETLRQSVEENRQSVSAVSLDEEMTNIIKFQHAYNAAARQITMIDEMLEKIINGMGVVGR